MNVTAIIIAALVVGAVGIILGFFLGISGEKFKVEVDPREEAILEVLPGNNCGGCGYPGCDGLAKAIAEGKAPVNACPVGGAPASLASPATPAAQAVPLGSAYALAARRSGPGPLAGGAAPQPSRGPGCGLLLQPLPLRGAAICTPPARAPQAGPLPALRAAGARGTPPAGGSAARITGRQGQGKPRAGRQAAHRRGPCLPANRAAGPTVAGVPPSGGSPARFSFWGFRWCFLCRMLSLVVCLALAVSGGSSAGLVVSLAGRCPGLLGRSGPLLWRRLLPVSRRRRALGRSGLLVLLSVGWQWCAANKKPHRVTRPGGFFSPLHSISSGAKSSSRKSVEAMAFFTRTV